MAYLRELLVGIDFKKVNTSILDRLDKKIDDVVDELEDMGDEIDDAMSEFTALAATGSAALQVLESEAKDTARAVDNIGDQARTSALSIVALGTAMSAAMALGTAAAAPLLATVLALSASLAAAGIGVVAFAAVAVPAINQVFTAAEDVAALEEKIASADTAKERIAAQKELAALYDSMSASQREALTSLQEFKAFWADFTKQFEDPIFDIFTNGLKATQSLLTGLAPTITNVSAVISDLMNEFNQSLQSEGAKEFFEWLEVNAAEALYSFAHIFGNVFQGIFHLMQAFSPLGASMEEGLLSMTENFKNWAASLGESNAFQGFIEYVKTNGPVLMDTIGNLGQIFSGVAEALAPLGEKLLGLLENFTQFLADSQLLKEAFQFLSDVAMTIIDNWGLISDVLISVAAGVAAFKIAMTGMQIIGAVTELFKLWRTATLIQTFTMLGLNAAMWANPITWIVIAIAALIAIGVMLYLNWDTVKAKALELWASLTEKWNSIVAVTSMAWGLIKEYVSTKFSEAKDKVVEIALGIWNSITEKFNAAKEVTSEAWDAIKTAIGNAMDSAKTAVSNFFDPLFNFIDRAKGAWDGFVGAIKNFKMPKIDFPSLPSWMGGGGADGSHATGLASVPFDGYRAVLHQNESVLTAQQSDALRSAGILGSKGDRPVINLDNQKAAPAPVVSSGGNNSTNSNTFAPQISIHISGGGNTGDISAQVEAAVEQKLMEFWKTFNNVNARVTEV